jgi:hypothetical protein|tara:strand:+ start:1470 stop:3215 length:1746 start_codon:yes stop_codon:yes gene_type:complete
MNRTLKTVKQSDLDRQAKPKTPKSYSQVGEKSAGIVKGLRESQAAQQAHFEKREKENAAAMDQLINELTNLSDPMPVDEIRQIVVDKVAEIPPAKPGEPGKDAEITAEHLEAVKVSVLNSADIHDRIKDEIYRRLRMDEYKGAPGKDLLWDNLTPGNKDIIIKNVFELITVENLNNQQELKLEFDNKSQFLELQDDGQEISRALIPYQKIEYDADEKTITISEPKKKPVRIIIPNPQVVVAGGGGGGNSGGGSIVIPLTNIFWCDKIKGNNSNDGSIGNPFKDIQKALDVIGEAANNTEWQDPEKQSFIVHAAPANYLEALAIPFRPYIRIMVDGVTITGNASMTIGDQMNGGGIISPQIVFASEGVRELWPDAGVVVQHGLVGSITVTSNSTTSNFAQINFDHCGITGSISMQGNYSGAQIRLDSALVGGKCIGPLSGGSTATVWARGALSNPDFGDVHGIGGASGRLNYGMLDNVLISGDVDATSTLTSRWVNSRFLSGKTYDFSNFSGLINMDANTFNEVMEFTAPVGSNPPPSIALIDVAEGVKFTPTASNPATNVQDAIANAGGDLLETKYFGDLL